MIKLSKKRLIVISVILIIVIISSSLLGLYIYDKNKIKISVEDTLPDGDGKKATVILLGGQSNASGCSVDECLKVNVSNEKYNEYQRGYNNVFINYLTTMNSSGGFIKCATNQGEAKGYFGPELGLAEKLNELYPNRTFYIIKCAWGGTNLFEQWLSPSSKGKTGDKYKYFTAFVDSNIKYLKSKNYDVKIEGMCWMQGESDSFSVESSKNYGEHLSNFISDIRNRYSKYASNNGIAFIDAYIADNPMFWVYCDNVNACKKEVSKQSTMNSLIDTIGNGLVCDKEPFDNPDIPHYDSLSQIKLGHLFAQEIINYLD